MNLFKSICQALVLLIRQIRALPQTISEALARKRRRGVLDEREVERLDRIRNPSKYLGK